MISWENALKYLEDDNPQAEENVISLAKEIILDEHKLALNLINDKFNYRPEIKMDIMKGQCMRLIKQQEKMEKEHEENGNDIWGYQKYAEDSKTKKTQANPK